MAASLGRCGAATLAVLCLLIAALPQPADARMRRPWESESEYEHNDKNKIPNRTPPKGWGHPEGAPGGVDDVPGYLAALTEEARGHCMKDGHQSDKAERSAACLMAQNGFLQQVAKVNAAGYITAQDLVDAEEKFTCAAATSPCTG